MRVGKNKNSGRREEEVLATRQSTPCGPLTDVAEIHTDKTREQSLRLLEECHCLFQLFLP